MKLKADQKVRHTVYKKFKLLIVVTVSVLTAVEVSVLTAVTVSVLTVV